ncbi:Aldo_ket_red domain-containing protein [Mucor velutinosus]|uniref:Aldo_ket_red domain-containing protein n=1 Tax=Mucor velutinosus TaxID=708070 RepID=A0AAN7D797_9FUNG|nr:Aldo_ket_red domain-containing protein [Mucor velutinosus]
MSAHKQVEQEELAIGTVIFTAGDAKQQADCWDDSELIDHWDRTVEAYRRQCLGQSKSSTVDPPYHQKKISHKTKQGHIAKSKALPRKKILPASKPALRKDIDTAIHANDTTHVPPPPQLPAMPGGSNNQEDLSNLMMAWYYCGYYTGLYQGQQQQ